MNMIRRHKLTRDTFEEKDIYASEESSAKSGCRKPTDEWNLYVAFSRKYSIRLKSAPFFIGMSEQL